MSSQSESEHQRFEGPVCVEIEPNRIFLDGDVVGESKTTDANSGVVMYNYEVRLRGGDCEVITVKSHQLESIASEGSERIRQKLYEEVYKSESSHLHLRTRLMAMEVSDDVHRLIRSGTDMESLIVLPLHTQKDVLVREIEAYYMNNGHCWSLGSRKCTSYLKALSPFFVVDHESDGVCTMRSGDIFNGQTSGTIFRRFVEQINQDPSQSVWWLLRAFSFCRETVYSKTMQWNTNDYVAPFVLCFFAVKVLQNEVEELKNYNRDIIDGIQKAFRKHGIDVVTRYERYGLVSKGKRGTTINDKHLLWCLVSLIFKIHVRVRARLQEDIRAYQMILPLPYGNVSEEIFKLSKALIAIRGDCAETYLLIHEMVMDTKDLASEEQFDGWMTVGAGAVQEGKRMAEILGDPFYCYTFQMLDLWYRPTSHGSGPVTPREAREILAIAKKHEGVSQEYVADYLFLPGKRAEKEFKAFLKTLSVPDDMNIPILPTNVYCSARWVSEKNKYFRVGGRGDNLHKKYQCINCECGMTSPLYCARCKKVAYCSKNCQRNDWKRHKKECSK